MSKDKLTELEICNRIVRLGDYIEAEYTSGKRMKGGRIKGNITGLWSLSHGDNCKQVQLDRGWCFHEGDKIIEYKPILVDEARLMTEPEE